jgi:hypothetical protein
LYPKFEQFPLEFDFIVVRLNLFRRFQFDPVDGLVGVVWFTIPDY